MRHRHASFLTLALAVGVAPALAQIPTPLPFAQLAPGDIQPNDLVGGAVDVTPGRAIVGSIGHLDPLGGSGSAWIFEQSSSWNTGFELVPADSALGDRFGHAVAIDGELALVGAYRDQDGGTNSGSVYAFERQPDGTWAETAKLLPSVHNPGDEFGHSVEVEGNRAAIGSPGANPPGAFVFERQPDGSWLEIAKLEPLGGIGSDDSGFDVSLSGDRVALGAHLDDDNGNSSGSAYVFERQVDGSWTQAAKVTAFDGASIDYFGYSVAISGDRLVVGAWLDDDLGSGSGSAYFFGRQPDGSWTFEQKVLCPDGNAGGHFGQSVAIDGDVALVGSIHDTVEIINPFGLLAPQLEAGSAVLYRRDVSGLWNVIDHYTFSEPDDDQNFGHCVAIQGGWIAIGSSDNDLFGNNAGLADVFYSYGAGGISEPTLAGLGTPGCSGPQSMGVNLPPLLGTPDFTFTCDAAPSSGVGFLLLGDVADLVGSDPFGLGIVLHVNLLASTPFPLFTMTSSPIGLGSVQTSLPANPGLTGLVLHAQSAWVWTTCSPSPLGLSTSNLLTLTIGA